MENEKNLEIEQEQLLSEIRSIRDLLYKQGPVEAVYGRMTDFYNEATTQMPEAKNFEVMHLLIGSSPSDGKHKGDLPEPFSVLSFLRALKKEYIDNPNDKEWGRPEDKN